MGSVVLDVGEVVDEKVWFQSLTAVISTNHPAIPITVHWFPEITMMKDQRELKVISDHFQQTTIHQKRCHLGSVGLDVGGSV
jgi:hypothetical protein